MTPLHWLLLFVFSFVIGGSLLLTAYVTHRVRTLSPRYGPEAILFVMFLSALGAGPFIMGPISRALGFYWFQIAVLGVTAAITAFAAIEYARMRWRG
jgi:hypothetical protein